MIQQKNNKKYVRAGLNLLKEQEAKLNPLRKQLAIGQSQLDKGLGVDGQTFMNE